jgi:outer membrane protein assembly factor BamA
MLTLSVAGNLGLLFPLHSFFRPSPPIILDKKSDIATNEPDFIPLSDRFHLGGPHSLRGFNLFGIGPRLPLEVLPPLPPKPSAAVSASASSSSLPHWPVSTNPVSLSGPSLGGVSKCSLLGIAAVPLPVPVLARLGAKLFGFINFGGIGETKLPLFSSANPLFGQIRLSAGAGVVVPVSNIARLELTYAIPLLKSSTDAVKPFQIGVGMTIN